MIKNFPELRRQNHKHFKDGWSKKQSIHGLDTETYEGKAILIADEDRHIEPESFSQAISFLTNIKYRNSYNFFYNIRFDFGAILKWLGEEDLKLFEQIVFNGQGIYKDTYNIYYIPNKIFSISSNKHKVQFFDLTNFYNGTLDNNAEHYLDKRKLTDINANKINIDRKYYYFNREKIIRYCKRDALLTKMLGEQLQEAYFNMMDIYPKNYISVASIAGNYFRQKSYVPNINDLPKEMLKYWWESFTGGRFEVYRKGFFPKVYDYDIVSAYPSTLSNLINIKIGKWKRVDKFSQDAYYGVYKCYVFSHYPNYIPPFGVKISNKLIFPSGELGILYLSKQEIEYIWNKHPELAMVKVIDGWEFYPKKLIYPFKDTVEKLNEMKSIAKNEYGKDSMEYIIPKKTSNSFYGKQLNINNDLIGNFWNIVYGCLITCDTKLKVLDLALKAGKSLISFEADGVFTDRKIEGVETGTKLGDWELTSAENQIVIANGVFTNSEKRRTRGFPRAGTNLEEIIKMYGDKKLYVKRYEKPVTLKEGFIHNKKSWKDINIWKKASRTISANSDKKRKWERYDYTFRELSENIYNSRPWWDMELGLGYIPE